MSILVNSTTRVITQGMTGKTGAYHTRACRAYANADNFVAGVNPRKAGNTIRRVWPDYIGSDCAPHNHLTTNQPVKGSGRKRFFLTVL